MTRSENCACGGTIYSEAPEFSTVAVDVHNQSLCHQVWRAVREGRFAASREGLTVRVDPVDLSGSGQDASTSPARLPH